MLRSPVQGSCIHELTVRTIGRTVGVGTRTIRGVLGRPTAYLPLQGRQFAVYGNKRALRWGRFLSPIHGDLKQCGVWKLHVSRPSLLYVYGYMYRNMNIRISIYIYMHTHMYACIYTYIYVHACIFFFTYVHVYSIYIYT